MSFYPSKGHRHHCNKLFLFWGINVIEFSGSNQKIKDQPVRTDKHFGNSGMNEPNLGLQISFFKLFSVINQ